MAFNSLPSFLEIFSCLNKLNPRSISRDRAKVYKEELYIYQSQQDTNQAAGSCGFTENLGPLPSRSATLPRPPRSRKDKTELKVRKNTLVWPFNLSFKFWNIITYNVKIWEANKKNIGSRSSMNRQV